MIAILLQNWRLAVFAALIASNALTFGLWRHAANGFADYKATVIAEGKVQAAQTRQTIATQKQITEDTTNGWKAALDTTRAYYASQRLRVVTDSGRMPAVSGPAAGTDGAGPDPGLAATDRTEDCAVTTLMINRLQDWVSRQQATNKTP